MPFLSELTSARWQTMVQTPEGIALQNGQTRALLSQPRGKLHEDADLAWLALRLSYAQQRRRIGGGFPLVLLGDPLLDSPNADRIFRVLKDSAAKGVQCLLLSSDGQIANQLAESDVPLVRVGLHEGNARRVSTARRFANEDQVGNGSLFQLAKV